MVSSSGQFDLKSSFDVSYAPCDVKKWVSSKTGLQLVLINQLSPIVSGQFAVATEINNDSGVPHTLEHLVFGGSKNFPYKGLLDTLAKRLYSDTNAWTATDQTVYTLNTAGWEGFNKLLPAYLDHILNPTLTDELCYTEVYHVDGNAKDKGVVYSEMQGIQNSSWFLNFLQASRALYGADSPYSSETGGLMENLRTLTNHQIKDFHKSSYRPSNLCVIVSGSVNESELLQTMIDFDNNLPSLSTDTIFLQRPFHYPNVIIPLTKSIVQTVNFPDKDESMGELSLSWIIDDLSNTLARLATDFLFFYLSDSSVSLFYKNFIEIDDPLAADVDYSEDAFIQFAFQLVFTGVPTNKMQQLESQFFSVLKHHFTLQNFDLTRMRDLIEVKKLKYLFKSENSTSIICDTVVEDFLYGNQDCSDLKPWVDDLSEYQTLSSWSSTQWIDFAHDKIINNHSVLNLIVPSKDLYLKNKKDNKKLIQDRIGKLGQSGLDKLKEKLKNAEDKNNIPIPDELILKFGEPDPEKIQFIKTETISTIDDSLNDKESPTYNHIINDLPSNFPLKFHFENFKSNFVKISIIFSSVLIPLHLLPYLSIFEFIFASPVILEDGTHLPYELVVSELNKNFNSYEFNHSFNSFNEVIEIKFQFKKENYNKAIQWITNILWFTVFDESRIKVFLEKTLNNLPDCKRDGGLMLSFLYNKVSLTDRSLSKMISSINSEQKLRDVLQKLQDGEKSSVLNDLETIRKSLFTLNNMNIFISGSISTLKNPVSSWKALVNSSKSIQGEIGANYKVSRGIEFLSNIGKEGKSKAFIIPVPATESSYLQALYSGGPKDFNDEDIPAIYLASEYLQAVEGPFWKGVRGAGLAYGANIYHDLEMGHMVFSVYRASDSEKALKVAKEIVENIISGKTTLEPILIKAAMSSIVNTIATRSQNNYSAATQNYLNLFLKKRGHNYDHRLMKELSKVTIDQLICVYEKYFLPIFESKDGLVFLSCHPSQLDNLEKSLQENGYYVTIENSVGGEENDLLQKENDNASDDFSESESDEDEDGSDDE
ncbi:Sdd3p ASCRUDRAFT_7736 [Ascoidea rubescens DSM 1968]|uniref:Zinc metalloprotease n=1 Tax=Ascoidea rubescens DSM 1968 TaxID=1344418 RepID=A0A1D2VIQ7_9ASCO|nr:hypothetical protein ASCRUDRAFT_7736 [Ascoidea rubescens DSM 1968]ODV61515.1 hypothetical protein ASCRUDRAFT_7736 [Ascoidea rubescens DSM 1968]